MSVSSQGRLRGLTMLASFVNGGSIWTCSTDVFNPRPSASRMPRPTPGPYLDLGHFGKAGSDRRAGVYLNTGAGPRRAP